MCNLYHFVFLPAYAENVQHATFGLSSTVSTNMDVYDARAVIALSV